MAEKKITHENTVLVAVDIAKHRNEVLIAEPGRRRRRRMVILNTREDHDRLIAMLRSYQLPVQVGFEATGKGNDKGNVEEVVGYARRNFMTPLPCFANWEALNAYLEEQGRKRQGEVLRGHAKTIGERLEQDLETPTALPPISFDACDKVATQVTSLSLVRYRSNDYSVPVALGHR